MNCLVCGGQTSFSSYWGVSVLFVFAGACGFAVLTCLDFGCVLLPVRAWSALLFPSAPKSQDSCLLLVICTFIAGFCPSNLFLFLSLANKLLTKSPESRTTCPFLSHCYRSCLVQNLPILWTFASLATHTKHSSVPWSLFGRGARFFPHSGFRTARVCPRSHCKAIWNPCGFHLALEFYFLSMCLTLNSGKPYFSCFLSTSIASLPFFMVCFTLFSIIQNRLFLFLMS